MTPLLYKYGLIFKEKTGKTNINAKLSDNNEIYGEKDGLLLLEISQKRG